VLFTITFFLVKAMPGGPFDADKKIPAHIKAKIEAYYGLDKPVGVQYLRQFTNYLKGDPGLSLRMEGRPVTEIIGQAFPVSLQLGVVAMIIALMIGIPAGCIAAARRNGLLDVGSMSVAMIGICLPSFVIGPILAETFGRNLKWFPAMGWNAASPQTWMLPALTLGLFYMAVYARLTRATMLEVQDQDFVKTARAKGVPEGRITRAHVLRNALLPVITFAGIQAGQLIGGSILVETVFAWPGIGRLAFEALLARDYAVLLGVFFCTSVIVVLFNLMTDLLYALIDPRVEVGG
jgi:ABC-type dipeptide/oligopeptide/nickel transport system permease component